MTNPLSSVQWARRLHLGSIGMFLLSLLLVWKFGLSPGALEPASRGSARPTLEVDGSHSGRRAQHLVPPEESNNGKIQSEVLQLIASFESGQPVSLTIGEGENERSWSLLCRPRPLFATGYRTSLGTAGLAFGAGVRS